MDYKQWFEDYTKPYLVNNEPALVEKYHHSKRVADLCVELTKDQKFYTVGLLHDIGRFPQWIKHKSFCDKSVGSHADISYNILQDVKFKLNYEELMAIKYHQEVSLYDHCNIYLKVIRDADKIDILRYVNTNQYVPHSEEPSLSFEVYNSYINKNIINLKDVRTKIDKLVLFLSWKYDINYYQTRRIINEECLFVKILDKLRPLRDNFLINDIINGFYGD